ncbi:MULTISPECIES: LysE family translocator [unclassified Caulobacter]|uniref:LysE family translocator n=1 Tax=unclassified Caulobacter TaxID=2648921 RepID=UPI000D356940|nr:MULTISPECIES: LysE family translocator [unclassified Caulobacter]PTS84660.1 LysE family translocator [Caulobacter sp. HMWF009]PTT10663.1 LysE family translocator [Caulobacter sp. HMWF025]PTT83294.1 LysE family translocator [Pseudomonas sp. HMWF010]
MTLPVDPARYGAFLATMFVMAITPGPANLFAIATGMEKGKGAALLGVVGMNCATLIWFAGSALGLGALIIAFPAAFHVLALAGAAYLVWLGLKSILAGIRNAESQATATVKAGRSALVDGFTVQIANPKALLFFTAVLPPFIDVNRPLPPQLAMFACATIGMDLISMSAYGLGGAALSARMNEPGFRRIFALAVGVLLISAAVLIVSRG